MVVEVIPYKSFRERIRLVKDIKKKDKKASIEIYATYLYIETKGELN